MGEGGEPSIKDYIRGKKAICYKCDYGFLKEVPKM